MKATLHLIDCPANSERDEDYVDHPFITIELTPENDADRVVLQLLEALEVHPESIGFDEEKDVSKIFFSSFPNNRKEDEKEEKQDGLAED